MEQQHRGVASDRPTLVVRDYRVFIFSRKRTNACEHEENAPRFRRKLTESSKMREERLSTLSAFLPWSVLLGASHQVPIFLSISPSILPEATASPDPNRRAKPVATCMTYNRNDRPCSPHVTHARASTITIPPLPRNNNPQQQHTFTNLDHHS